MNWSARLEAPKLLIKRHWLDLSLCLFLAAVTLLSRWAMLEPIEVSGDPLDYWYFVKSWFYGGEFGKLDHHDARFGIHIWLFLVQLFWGESAEYTYIAPLFVSVMVTLLTYVLARQLTSRAAAALAAFLVIEFDNFVRLSSQIRPEMFGAMYILASSIALIAYGRSSPERRLVPFFWATAFLVLGYLTRLDNLLFTPAFVLLLWSGHRRWRDVLLFCGLLLAGFLAETLLHMLLAGGSRLTAEVPRGAGAPLSEYAQVTQRMTKYLEDSGKLVFYPFFASAPALLALTRGKKTAHAGQVLVLFPLCFLLLVVFGIRSTDPIRPFMPMISRYLDAAAPHCLICTSVVVQQGVAAILPHAARFWNRRATGVVSLLGVLGVLGGHALGAVRLLERRPLNDHPFFQARRQFMLISNAYERGLPIIGPSDKPIGRGKARTFRSPPLHWAHKAFVRSELLLNDKGKLPEFEYRLTRQIAPNSRTMYIPKDLRQKDVAAANAARSCAVILERRGRFVNIRGSHTELPEHCQSLRREKTRRSQTDPIPLDLAK
jgi:hypothetical protein